MSKNDVCYTFEAAIESAIEMENAGFRHYLAAMRKVSDKGAQEILRENALDELNHKYRLEMALLDGKLTGGEMLTEPIQAMHIDYAFSKDDLVSDAGMRGAMIYAIHMEKGAVDFYSRAAKACASAPMAGVFTQLIEEESRHLKKLEAYYEKHFMS
ncbi:MAG: ferritin family protein [Candidatus Hydrogenedentes bacterium]|nr:ferritin family protein [Candidatus Hydrogenedentota bacterium]